MNHKNQALEVLQNLLQDKDELARFLQVLREPPLAPVAVLMSETSISDGLLIIRAGTLPEAVQNKLQSAGMWPCLYCQDIVLFQQIIRGALMTLYRYRRSWRRVAKHYKLPLLTVLQEHFVAATHLNYKVLI